MEICLICTTIFHHLSTMRHRQYQTSCSDTSAKIRGLYLSQAKKLDKEHSGSWIENVEGVLVFVLQNLIHKVTKYCTHTETLVRLVFSAQL